MGSSAWDKWSAKDLSSELINRMNFFYKQVDGSILFPNSAEGDLLKMVYSLLIRGNAEAFDNAITVSQDGG